MNALQATLTLRLPSKEGKHHDNEAAGKPGTTAPPTPAALDPSASGSLGSMSAQSSVTDISMLSSGPQASVSDFGLLSCGLYEDELEELLTAHTPKTAHLAQPQMS